ncbi:BEN domain-containing protein 5-like [Rhipicephalus microplus]|uniref:BEN domain-containing protein 5-like n=1 Tax=Rhipicephalus microplus TaxID=6941 RepID=UPI003F6AFB2C
MFAFVRFRDDNQKRIVPIASCKHLEPKDTSDFNHRKWYKVFWEDDTHCGHYHAQVIRLYETEDDARKATEKRTSIPQRPYSDSSESCSSEVEDLSFEEETRHQATVQQKKKAVDKHFKKRNRDLLFGDAGKEKTEAERLKEDVSLLRAENAKLLERIRMLEEALCNKIFETEKKLVLCECCSHRPTSLKEAAPLALPCTSTFEPLCTAAVRPPETVAVRPPRTATMTRGSTDGFDHRVVSASGCENSEQLPGQIVTYVPTNGEVQLGRGIAISEGVYSRLMSTKSETRFVREAAVAIFSTAGLVGRSVTGAACNRNKGEAKPPLDKERYTVLSDFFSHYLKNSVPIGEVSAKMKILNKALANKINDLMKSKN